jgi:hypothetical protein
VATAGIRALTICTFPNPTARRAADLPYAIRVGRTTPCGSLQGNVQLSSLSLMEINSGLC